MSRIVVIGGIESSYQNAQLLHELGEEICMFFTRGENSPGWEGVDLIDESKFSFASQVPKTIVQGSINDHLETIKQLKPDFIWSLGWQQMYRKTLLNICPVMGIHESLLPQCAGAVPLANAILRDYPETGVTLFQLDEGVDTGPIIGQLKCQRSPRTHRATDIFNEMMELEAMLIKTYVPRIRQNRAPRIPQDLNKRTVYGKVNWAEWPEEKVKRARTYPYQ